MSDFEKEYGTLSLLSGAWLIILLLCLASLLSSSISPWQAYHHLDWPPSSPTIYPAEQACLFRPPLLAPLHPLQRLRCSALSCLQSNSDDPRPQTWRLPRPTIPLPRHPLGRPQRLPRLIASLASISPNLPSARLHTNPLPSTATATAPPLPPLALPPQPQRPLY